MRPEIEISLVDIGLVLLFFVLPHDINGDGPIRFQALGQLLEQGRVSGMPYSFVAPLFSAPLYLVGTVYLTPYWWCARFNTVVFGGGLAATYWLLRAEVDRLLLRRFFLLLIAGSMFPNYLRGYGGEVFTAVFVTVGIVALRFGRPLAGWTAVVLGVANTPAALVGLALVTAAQVWETRQWRHAAPLAAAAALIMLEAWVRRGGPLISGYENNSGAHTLMPYSGRPGFSYPLLFGVFSILFSFGKGVLFFAPGLLLPITVERGVSAIADRLRAAYHLWIWFLIGLIVVYAKWWSWYGGWSWGPRFFLVASVPASLAIAVRLQRVREAGRWSLVATLLALTLSVWVGLDGAVFDQRDLSLCVQNTYALEFVCWYTPEFSVLWHPFVNGLSLSADQIAIAVYFLIVYLWLAVPIVFEIVGTAAATLAAARARRETPAWRL
jgi:hypothetical protein